MSVAEHNEELLKSLSNPSREERARSLLDLIELNTFDLELAAWFMAQVSRGASFISGSGPGGVGKTTTMRSFLSFVPANLRFARALPNEIAGIGDGHCLISDELSDHRPPTYLWDQDLRDFFNHSEKNNVLVGNMHADDLDEVHEQIVSANQVPESQFRYINLFVFMCLEGGNPPGERRVKDTTTRRIINKVFYSDGHSEHQSVYSFEEGLLENAPRDEDYERRCRTFLEETLKGSERTLEGVRSRFLEWNH